jgi:hypothetical protein
MCLSLLQLVRVRVTRGQWIGARMGGSSVLDIKSQGQPACRENQKNCKEESVNAVHECDVDKMYI